jgi:4-amino-4-deoxy-L-arabinose transferase-like glycosyltransferase
LWNRRFEPIHLPSPRAWMIGGAATIAVALPWFIVIALHSGLHAVIQLIGHYTFGRYTGVIENQAGPVWYYLPVMILGFFPWIAFFPMALVYGVRHLRTPNADPRVARLVRLGLTWVVMPLVFFSFAKTKLPNYIALEFPALALVTALYFDTVVRRGVSRSAIISAATVPVFIGMVAFAIWAFTRDNRIGDSAQSFIPDLLAMGIVIFVGSLLTAFLLSRRSTERSAPYALAAATLASFDILAVVALPHAELFKPVPQLASIVARDRKPGDVVAIQDFRGANALAFYAGPGVLVLGAPDTNSADVRFDPKRIICGAPRVWVVAPKRRPAFDPTYGRNRQLIAQAGTGALFLYDGPGCR